MRILVTGDKGFVGTETVRLLKEHGHEVVGFDLMDGFDIRDEEQLDKVFSWYEGETGTYSIDRTLHLAAIARFSDADKDPKLAFETNVEGTKNVAKVAAKYHIPLVYASTGSVYMPIHGIPENGIDETLPAKGNSVYGCTKYLGETYVRERTPHIILRYAHLYGKEKRHHGLIGGFTDRISRGLEPVLYGGVQSNDFTYIKDVARANLLALEAPWDAWNQVYNIGTGEELSAKTAGEAICKATGYQGKIDIKEGRTVDAERFFYNTKKATQMLGFTSEYDFEGGLADMFQDE